jgi:hypothetical protein
MAETRFARAVDDHADGPHSRERCSDLRVPQSSQHDRPLQGCRCFSRRDATSAKGSNRSPNQDQDAYEDHDRGSDVLRDRRPRPCASIQSDHLRRQRHMKPKVEQSQVDRRHGNSYDRRGFTQSRSHALTLGAPARRGIDYQDDLESPCGLTPLSG